MNIPQKSRRFFTGGWTHWGEHLIREHAHCFGDVEIFFWRMGEGWDSQNGLMGFRFPNIFPLSWRRQINIDIGRTIQVSVKYLEIYPD